MAVTTEQTGKQTRRTRIVTVLLPIISILVLSVGAETLVRVTRPALAVPGRQGQFRFDQKLTARKPTHVRDAELGWRLEPNQDTGIRTNSRGYRTKEFEDTKPPQTIRVVFLGDSNPLGFGIEDEDSPYPTRTQQVVDKFFPGVIEENLEVINLGVDGYSSFQTRRLAEGLLPRISPDVVCIQVGFNDYCYSPSPDGPGSFRDSRFIELLERSKFYRWSRRQLMLRLPPRELVAPVRRVDLDDFENNIRSTIDLARGGGATVMLVSTPTRPTVPLVTNEVEVHDADGIVWTTQTDWIAGKLRAKGLDPPHQPKHPEYRRVVENVAQTHPNWAMPPYLLAAVHRNAGRTAEADDLELLWRSHDSERAVFAEYKGALERVASSTEAIFIDVDAELEKYRIQTGAETTPDLFIDFVHMDVRGHVLLATAVANELVRLYK